jgi:signal transduction histidine kinase
LTGVRRSAAVAAAATFAIGEGALVADDVPWPVLITDATAAGVLLVLAFVAARRQRRLAVIAAAAAVAWLVPNVVGGVGALHRPLVVHLALAADRGRLRRRADLGVVVGAWVTSLALPDHPAVTATLGGLVMLAAVVPSRRARAGTPRGAHYVAAAGAAVAAALAWPALVRIGDPTDHRATTITVLHAACIAIAACVVLAATATGDDRSRAVADDVVELASLGGTSVEELLAGARVHPAVHDDAIDAAIGSVLMLLEDNRRLHDDLATQVEEVRASRRRLVEADDVERRRLAERLDATTGRRLAEVDATVGALRAAVGPRLQPVLDRVRAELDATHDDLGQLAQGLHPRLLVEEGLCAALVDLAARCPLPLTVDAPAARYPAVAETAIWYVCAEATANIVKHSAATAAGIALSSSAGQLVVEVVDDGCGGADLDGGSGLIGLRDRLEAIGGGIKVESARGRGTRLSAWVPI